MQSQIIRLLSYAPMFKHGNGEFHEWEMVKAMLDRDVQQTLPVNMGEFMQSMKLHYVDFDYKMDADKVVMVAFTKSCPPEPRARNYVTERVMQYCRAHGVRHATISQMIEFADPHDVYKHKPEHFIDLIKRDTARCYLEPHESDPSLVQVHVHPHVSLMASSARKQSRAGHELDRYGHKRARTMQQNVHPRDIGTPELVAAPNSGTCRGTPIICQPELGSASSNASQLPVPLLQKTIRSMR
jgi:hypothetical protein